MNTIEKGSLEIKKLLESSEPCLIGRFGTVECQALFGLDAKGVLERNAGVFGTDKDIQLWKTMYRDSFAIADSLALGWYLPTKDLEQKVLVNWKGIELPLRSLEPFYVSSEFRWSYALEKKRVCVVTSFAETASKQVQKSQIWKDKVFPDSVEWSFVKTGYSPSLAQGRAGWSDVCDAENWKDACKYVMEEVEKTNAEVVLVGCGGLGMIIGAELKKKGKKCIVLGGAVQVLMGIKGRRWETHSVISRLWNEHWVWPSEEETPGGAREVEGSCYWH